MAFNHYTGTLTGEDHSLVDMLDTNLVAAGWSIAFTSGTSIRVYRNGAAGSHRYWRIRDNGPNVTSTFKEAWIRGWGVKADVNDTADASNTNPFPSAANLTNGQVIRKSASADATVRTYHLYADARTAILMVYTGDNAGQAMIHYFGDYYDLLAGSIINAITACRGTENSSTQTVDSLQVFSATTNKSTLLQSYTGAGNDVLCGFNPVAGMPNSAMTYAGTALPFPNGPDGGRYLSQVLVAEGAAPDQTIHYRGRMRGLWKPLNGISTYADGDTITGTGALAARTFTLHKCGGGFYAIETSDTLEVN